MFRLCCSLLLLVPLTLCAQSKGPKVPEGTKVEKNLAYGTHERQKLDLYVPAGKGPFPLILWVHGGAWEGGNKDGGIATLGMLERGYAVASTNYRLTQHAKHPAQINDVKGAVKYLRANAEKYNLDPKHFGVAGASAGGHLVALLGTSQHLKELDGDVGPKDTSCEVQCVLDFFGPSDLISFPLPMSDNPITRFLGGTTGEKKALALEASPITHVSKKAPPFLIVQGDADNVVPLKQSEILQEALKQAGADSRLIVVKGGGHGDKCFTPELMTEYAKFFDEHLRKK